MSIRKPWYLCGADFPDSFIGDFVGKAVIPPFFCSDFDTEKFCRMVLGSLSLSLVEKNRIFDSLPTLSLFQCDELEKVFSDETAQFFNMHNEYLNVLRLSAGSVIGACALALHRGAGIADKAEETAMIQAMGRTKRKSSKRLAGYLKIMPIHQPVVVYVYGETQVCHSDTPEITKFLRQGI